MKSTIAIKIMLGILSIIILFHFSILMELIPHEVTWGGRITNDAHVYVFETISLVVNLFLLVIILIKGKLINEYLSSKIVNVLLWGFLTLFVLNTIGNILAETNEEKLFAIVTLALSYLIWSILKKDKQ